MGSSRPLMKLPEEVRALLHDCDPDLVTWEEHRDFLVDRVLSNGNWSAVRWLRNEAGDDSLRRRITATRGRRLSPGQLRFWQLILEMPEDEVTGWLADEARAIWDRRSA